MEDCCTSKHTISTDPQLLAFSNNSQQKKINKTKEQKCNQHSVAATIMVALAGRRESVRYESFSPPKDPEAW